MDGIMLKSGIDVEELPLPKLMNITYASILDDVGAFGDRAKAREELDRELMNVARKIEPTIEPDVQDLVNFLGVLGLSMPREGEELPVPIKKGGETAG